MFLVQPDVRNHAAMRKAYHLQSGGGGRPHTSRGREKERRRVAAHLLGLLPQIMSSKPVSGSKHHYADGAGRVTKESRGGLGPIKAACVCPGRTAHSLQAVRNMMQTAWDDNAKQREKLDSKALAFVAEQQSAAAAGGAAPAGPGRSQGMAGHGAGEQVWASPGSRRGGGSLR